MSDDLDEILDARLSALLSTGAVPGHGSGFWEAVGERLERVGTEGSSGSVEEEPPGRAIRTLALTPAPNRGPERPPEDPHGFHRRVHAQVHRWLPLGVAAGIIALALAASAALGGVRADEEPPADPSPSVSPTQPPSPAPSVPPSVPPSARRPDETTPAQRSVNGYGSPTVTELEAVEATTALRGFGPAGPLHVDGTPEFAWTWRDRTGEHLLVLSAVRTHDDEAPELEQDDSTLYSKLFRHFENEDGVSAVETERTMLDPGADPCSIGYPDGFLPKATKLSDTDGDGVGEVSVAWYYACRGDIGQESVKLAVLEGADKYILRGSGYRFEGARKEYGGDEMVRDPEPVESSWPQGLFDHAIAVWDTIIW